jgi:hypothetical protein
MTVMSNMPACPSTLNRAMGRVTGGHDGEPTRTQPHSELHSGKPWLTRWLPTVRLQAEPGIRLVSPMHS